MNKYKNAGGKEMKEFLMIKCPVCGFKDATSDALTWTCPECEAKIKRIVQAVKYAQKIEIDTEEKKEELKEGGMVNALAELKKSLGIEPIKPPEPPKPEIVKEYKVGGLSCKIVTTKRK